MDLKTCNPWKATQKTTKALIGTKKTRTIPRLQNPRVILSDNMAPALAHSSGGLLKLLTHKLWQRWSETMLHGNPHSQVSGGAELFTLRAFSTGILKWICFQLPSFLRGVPRFLLMCWNSVGNICWLLGRRDRQRSRWSKLTASEEARQRPRVGWACYVGRDPQWVKSGGPLVGRLGSNLSRKRPPFVGDTCPLQCTKQQQLSSALVPIT